MKSRLADDAQGFIRLRIVDAKTRFVVAVAGLSNASDVDDGADCGGVFVGLCVRVNSGKMRMPDETFFSADVLKIPRGTHPVGDVMPLVRIDRRGMDEHALLAVDDERQRSEILAVFVMQHLFRPTNGMPYAFAHVPQVRRMQRPFVVIAENEQYDE